MTTHGDYTGLARDYAEYRPGYAAEMPAALLGLAARSSGKERSELVFVDVGAGTGIWTRMVAATGCRTIAIEPNAEMRRYGQEAGSETPIEWRAGSAERTGLAADSADLLTMASSFHWTAFDAATEEFARVLRPGGVFAALWNTRCIEVNPLLVEIEAELMRKVPQFERRSSGRSAFCDGLTERLAGCGQFSDVTYLEGQHVERMTPERYLGIWRSVNDVRVQAGEQVFADFLNYIDRSTRSLEYVDATYLTRIWAARVPDGSS